MVYAQLYYLLLFFHVRAENQPIIQGMALYRKKFEDSWVKQLKKKLEVIEILRIIVPLI
jgi:hypothetical protein